MKRFILLLAGLLAGACALAAPAASAAAKGDDVLRPARELLAQGRHAEAYADYARHAKRQDSLAQFMLGMFHEQGWGRPVDREAACRWFAQAAQGGVPAAQHFTGDCMVRPARGAADERAALDWYAKATLNGHFISLCSAAEIHIRGRSVPQDVERGLALCTQAAQSDSPPAMLLLARYYQDDPDVPTDLARARHWYAEAAQRRVAEAQYRLGVMLAQGEGGPADLNAALFWLETAASEGYAPAYLPTARLYLHAPPQPDTGAPTPDHLAKAYLWSRAARMRGGNPVQIAAAEQVQTDILAWMPVSWQPALDNQVTEHLARHPQ
jgi:TPR repeat protein